jgi:hypothetical protein
MNEAGALMIGLPGPIAWLALFLDAIYRWGQGK